MSIEIIGLRFTHRKSIKPSLYGPFFNYFGGGILRYYLHPGEYVAVKIVEQLFGNHRRFNYFMCVAKDSDIENRGGSVTHLTIPIQEMREYRDALCMELFGKIGLRSLDTTRRVRLARVLKSRYNSSTKQIARLCGLAYDELNDLL